MPILPNEIQAQYDAHIEASNPHKVTKSQIWGLDKVENVSDSNKPINDEFQSGLDKKMNISDIYNSTAASQANDLSTRPWSAAQGYQMNNVISTWQSQDTTELEARITECKNNV